MPMDRLSQAAQVGDTNELYNCVREETDALRRIDEAELIDTPLHIAADRGHVNFAMAMMYLKPSCGKKLNKDIYSPMHLAVRNGHTELVLGLMAVDKDLVRVKGREGYTALHCAAEKGNVNLLAQFLKYCPTCIEDVTIRNETALHIAAQNDQFEALEILAFFLQRTQFYCKVSKRHLLDSKDRNGDTVLHIVTSNTRPQMLRLLLGCKVNMKEINKGGMTAFDLLLRQSRETPNPNREICLTIVCKGKMALAIKEQLKNIFSNHKMRSLQESLRFKVTIYEEGLMLLTSEIANMSADKINALLVVLALILTTTYQAMLSPPGDFWQAGAYYIIYFRLNFLVFFITSLLTVSFLQVASGSNVIGLLFEILLSLLIGCLLVGEQVMSPTKNTKARINLQSYLTTPFCVLFVALMMEIWRRITLHCLNPPTIRFFKNFFHEI